MGLVDQTIEPLGPGKVSTLEYLERCSVAYAKQLAEGSLKRKQKKPKVTHFFIKNLNFCFKTKKL